MTTPRTTWPAQIAVVLVLLAAGTASASSGVLAGNSPPGKNSLEGGFRRAEASVSAEGYRAWGDFCHGEAADSVVAPKRVVIPTQQLALPAPGPVVIAFPVRKGTLNPIQRQAFIEHLAEQEAQLNALSASELRLNLDNYKNIDELKLVDRSRRLANKYLGEKPPEAYPGQTFDAAHRLDAVAGGHMHDIIGWRDSKAQQLIGSLWRERRNLIEPGLKHRLVPIFEE
jgi:hypothetical protein